MATPLSLTAGETARKGMALALRCCETPGKGAALAQAMGVSEASISRIKNERMDEVIQFLAHLGLQVIPVDYEVLDPHSLEFLKRLHAKVTRTAPHLLWEPE